MNATHEAFLSLMKENAETVKGTVAAYILGGNPIGMSFDEYLISVKRDIDEGDDETFDWDVLADEGYRRWDILFPNTNVSDFFVLDNN